MTTKTRIRPLPLSRRERRTLDKARGYGVTIVGHNDAPATNPNVIEMLTSFTDTERNAFFHYLEDWCCLEASLRTGN